MEAHQAIALSDKVEGWLTPREARLLFRLAQQTTGKGAVVEIGSWKGKSTVLLALGSAHLPETTIYAIDPHTGSPEHQAGRDKVWTFDQFKENLRRAGVEKKVTPILKMSNKAMADVPDPIEFIFIDGAHEYEAVKADFDLWYPKVMEGGVMAFHDTVGWPGPRKVVRDHLFKSTNFKTVEFADSIVYGIKQKSFSHADRLKKEVIWSFHQAYAGAFYVATRPAIKPILKKLLGR